MFLHSTLNLKLQKIFDQDILSGVDPTKLFFFANEEFFRFSLVSLRFCYFFQFAEDDEDPFVLNR